MKTPFWHRAVSFLSSFSLLIQTFTPFFSVPMTVRAQESLKSDISYSIGNKDFKFGVNNKDAGVTTGQLQYQLSYKNDSSDNPEQIEVAQGTADLGDNNFEKTIDAATCSTNGTCIVHQAPRGILKLKLSGWTDIKWFSISGESVTVINEKLEGVMDNITDEERNWLLKGDAPAPTATTAPPTPTIEPTVAPTEVPLTLAPTLTAPTVTIVPTGAVMGANGDEVVQAVIIDSQAYVDPSIWTNQADYTPTQKVIVSGKNFTPGYIYTISISSNDQPAVNATGSVTSAADGTFTYEYQLDGNYRPNYLVQVKDTIGTVVAQTSFTDAPASGCQNDSSGPNDVPNQKDLTKMCANYSGLPSSIGVTWNWDDTQLSGGNTGDACALFDTNSNGLANYAVCVQIDGNPAVFKNQYVYRCDDSSATNCLGNVLLTPSGGTRCSTGITPTDPFSGPANKDKGDYYPNDTTASCNVNLNDVGGGVATLTDVCSYPSASTPSNASDCTLYKTNAGKLTVTKVLSPNTDPGRFNLQINGVTQLPNAGDGGTTLTQEVSVGSNTIGETAGSSGLLSDYTSSTVCKDSHGTGNVVATTGTNPWTLNVADGQDILCTITNARNSGSIELNKIWSGTGGQTTLHIGTTAGGTDVASQQTGANGIAPLTTGTKTVNSGTYYVSETGGLTNYTSSLACTDNGISVTAGASNSISVSSGHTVVCTFTNTLNTGTITIVKNTVGGDGSFGFSSTIPTHNSFTLNTSGGTAATTFSNITAGNYSVSESVLNSMWDFTGLACDDPTSNTAVNGMTASINLTAGANVTCTYTNTKKASLTVVKHVNNDFNGTLTASSFMLHVLSGTTDVSGSPLAGSEAGTQYNLTPGTYVVNEGSLPAGYEFDGYSGDCDINGTVTLAAGQAKTCTLTNSDVQPKLIVIKHVINDNGGSASAGQFPINIIGSATPSFFNGSESPGTEVLMKAGAYSVSESGGPAGYTPAYSADCSGSIAVGQTKTCTITNNDQAATLIIKKTVVNDDGGTKTAPEFSFQINGGALQAFEADGQNILTVNAGTYNVAEPGVSGYTSTFRNCSNIVIANGSTATCEIENNDVAPTLTLMKEVTNDNGGSAIASSWLLAANGSVRSFSGVSGVMGAVTAGISYTLSEANGPTGYSPSNWVCTGGVQSGNTITLGLADRVTCTIINNDNAPGLHLRKTITNDNGGTAGVTDWTLTATGPTTISGTSPVDSGSTFIAGTYTLSETGPAGYTASDWVCDGGRQSGSTITVGVGESATCTINNNDNAPGLKLVKNVINDNGGTSDASAWTMTAVGDKNGFSDTGDSTIYHTVTAGVQYAVGENGPDGYDYKSFACDKGSVSGNTVVLGLGEQATCTVANDDRAPSLTLVKTVTNDNGGHANAADWTLTASGPTTISGAGGAASDASFKAGIYTLSESTGPAGYSAGTWNCVNGSQDGNKVAIGLGEKVTCTLNNDDMAPQLHLRKEVILNNGGTATATDWTLYATGSAETASNLSGKTPVNSSGLFQADTYTLGESGPSGYAASEWSCVKNNSEAVLGSSITLGIGDDATCTITNRDIQGTLIVKKIVSNTHGGSLKPSDFTIQVTGTRANPATFAGSVDGTAVTLNAGSYSVDEVNDFGYSKTLGENCSGTIANGETKTCLITNEDKQGILIITKHVINDDGGTKSAHDFQINVTGGNVLPEGTFPGNEEGTRVTVDIGTYSVDEAEMTGYTKTIGEGCRGTIGAGEIKRCTITNNDNIKPSLTLSKFNTTWPNDTSAGNDVEYHLKVHVDDNSISGIVVTDLMPAGFKYVTGSYHVFKNGVDITGDISEPVYHSPGKWYLGDAKMNDTFELIYTAAIDGGQKPGLYKDLAWAFGCADGTDNCSAVTGILATAAAAGTTDSGLLGADTFVGTKVNLNRNDQDSPTVKLTSSQGEVLGASTSLPSTGTPNWLFIISLLFTMSGFFVAMFGFHYKRALRFATKMTAFVMAASVFMVLTGAVQASDNLFIRLAQPKSPTRSNDFTLSYTAMDLVGGSALTVRCYKRGPSDGSFSQMGSDISVIDGGNNGLCPFDSSIMNNNGTYQFYATADSANGSAISETISVDYNTSGPGSPSSYGKDKISSCEYKIHFKTADDGKTTKVEIYRSENTSFTADGGTRVSTLNIGPNQEGTYNDIVPDCNKAYYYAVRAFDSAGNGSGVIGDSATTTTTSTSASSTGTGALPVANVTLGAGAQEGSVLGVSEEKTQVSSSSGKAVNDATVLAAETKKADGGLIGWIFGHKKISLGVLVILSLLVFGAIRYARKQGSTSGPNFQ